LLLKNFFPIVDTCLSCKDIAGQICAMVHRWQFFDDFLRSVFAASRVQHVSDLHLKLVLCGNMADIQSATSEIRQEKKKPQDENITVCPIP